MIFANPKAKSRACGKAVIQILDEWTEAMAIQTYFSYFCLYTLKSHSSICWPFYIRGYSKASGSSPWIHFDPMIPHI
jgi:hypothetical protein